MTLWHRVHLLYQAACGLAFLHHGCDPPIRHCDLTPSNILLDATLNRAKVSDFGLARPLRDDDTSMNSTSATLRGTFGYLCPVYLHTMRYTLASDVYSFGIIVLQLIAGDSNRDTAVARSWRGFCEDKGELRQVDRLMPGAVPYNVL